VELKLIQVMISEMQMIQFDSAVNLIQMKLMKMIDTHENMMIQEFQYPQELQQWMMMENDELIDDQQYQQDSCSQLYILDYPFLWTRNWT
jgi:hypothetical protein